MTEGVWDLFSLLFVIAFFGVAVLLVRACALLVGPEAAGEEGPRS